MFFSEGKKRYIHTTLDPQNDTAVAEKYCSLHSQAVQGALNHWADLGPEPCLALIILLDRFSLQLYRGKAYGFDLSLTLAVPLCEKAIEKGYDLALDTEGRLRCYLPLLNAESLNEQERSRELYARLAADRPTVLTKWMAHTAESRCRTLKEYGRFPERNLVYGRTSTGEEIRYLLATSKEKGLHDDPVVLDCSGSLIYK